MHKYSFEHRNDQNVYLKNISYVFLHNKYIEILLNYCVLRTNKWVIYSAEEEKFSRKVIFISHHFIYTFYVHQEDIKVECTYVIRKNGYRHREGKHLHFTLCMKIR